MSFLIFLSGFFIISLVKIQAKSIMKIETMMIYCFAGNRS